MLKQLQYFALIILATILISSCSDRDINFGGGNGGGTDITANINGTPWGVATGYARVVPPFGLEIYGADNQTTLSIYITPYNGPGTYQLNGNTIIKYTEGGAEYTATIGQVVINTDDGTYVQGSFACQAFNSSVSLEFTDGWFGVQKN